jgi:hypothetical protein
MALHVGRLNLPPYAKCQGVQHAAERNKLAESTFMGTYARWGVCRQGSTPGQSSDGHLWDAWKRANTPFSLALSVRLVSIATRPTIAALRQMFESSGCR